VLPLRPISAEARRVLTTNRWPGNVRELENTMPTRGVLMASATRSAPRRSSRRTATARPVAHPARGGRTRPLAAEQVTRALVGRTVADVERDLILETLKQPRQPHPPPPTSSASRSARMRNKLNEYADAASRSRRRAPARRARWRRRNEVKLLIHRHPDNALGALIRNLEELKKIPGSPLRGAPE